MGVGDVGPLPGDRVVLAALSRASRAAVPGPFVRTTRVMPNNRWWILARWLGWSRRSVSSPARQIRLFHSSAVTSMVAEQARAQPPIGPGMFRGFGGRGPRRHVRVEPGRGREANSRTVSSLELLAAVEVLAVLACRMTCGMRVRLIGIRPPGWWLSRWWDKRRCGARAAMTR